MISCGKFSVVLSRCFVVCAGRIFFACKNPEVDTFTPYTDERLPFFSYARPANPSVSAGVFTRESSVNQVLRTGGFAEIVSRITERISVFMVNLKRIFGCHVKNLSMHKNLATRAAISGEIAANVKTLCASLPGGAPVPLVEPFIVCGIDDCNLAASKWDVSNRLILRLNNRVALDAAFGHDSTSNGIAAVQPLFNFSRKAIPCA